jgi:hypothetical protein
MISRSRLPLPPVARRKDHGGEDADGEIRLKVGHQCVTQSIDGT